MHVLIALGIAVNIVLVLAIGLTRLGHRSNIREQVRRRAEPSQTLRRDTGNSFVVPQLTVNRVEDPVRQVTGLVIHETAPPQDLTWQRVNVRKQSLSLTPKRQKPVALPYASDAQPWAVEMLSEGRWFEIRAFQDQDSASRYASEMMRRQNVSLRVRLK